ncbi:hypothetical protein DSO57_1018440 [Entomophthora muscae]|uniref:Uncharacterized protein n=1 Tax=Entomophthora muscae TaxID=34485 RepID=A0ACC2UQ64_9FUNG|nr:hypothetical protein DSO57_1018440 [Entomophthora muscae]
MPANLGVIPPVFETGNCVASQCPEFYSEDTLMLSQYFNWKSYKQYLKPRWWLIINSMWIWVTGPHQELQRKKVLFDKYLNDGKGKCYFAITQLAALDFVRPDNKDWL